MKSNYKLKWLRKTTALSLTLSLLAATSMVAFAAPGNTLMGELTVVGGYVDGNAPTVSVNGNEALSGRTINSSSVIKTNESTSATIRLRNLGTVQLAPNSTMSISFGENSISGALTEGSVSVNHQSNVVVRISTTNGIAKNKSSESGVVSVNAKGIPKQDDDDDDNGALVPVLIVGGIVAVALIYVLTREDDDPITVSDVI